MVVEVAVEYHHLFGRLARARKITSNRLLPFLQGRSFWKRSNLPFLHILASCSNTSNLLEFKMAGTVCGRESSALRCRKYKTRASQPSPFILCDTLPETVCDSCNRDLYQSPGGSWFHTSFNPETR